MRHSFSYDEWNFKRSICQKLNGLVTLTKVCFYILPMILVQICFKHCNLDSCVYTQVTHANQLLEGRKKEEAKVVNFEKKT